MKLFAITAVAGWALALGCWVAGMDLAAAGFAIIALVASTVTALIAYDERP